MKTYSHFVAICLAGMLVLAGQNMVAAGGATDATGTMVLCIGTSSVVVYMDENGELTLASQFCSDCTLNVLEGALPVLAEEPLRLIVTPHISMAYIAAQSDIVPLAYFSRAPPSLT